MINSNYKRVSITHVAAILLPLASFAMTVDFSEFSLGPESNYGGAGSGAGNFTSQGVEFSHSSGTFSWEGFSYSNRTDTTTPGFTNQFSAITGQGFGDANYGVSFIPLDFGGGSFDPIPQSISFSTVADIDGLYLTNTTYAYLSMRDGDGFAKQFGGASGDDEDFYKVIITGKDSLDQTTGTTEFFLADYRFADNSQDYLIDDWTFVDLSSLGNVSSLTFSIDSSDTGGFGINTPAYFALDNLSFTPVPEPHTYALFAGLFVAVATFLRRRKN